MDGRYFPVAKDRFGHWMHVAQEAIPFADGKVVDVADAEIMRRIRGGDSFLRSQIVLVLRRLACSAFIARIGEDLGESIRNHHVQSVVEAML